jgi:hypothetical protein
MPNLPKDDPALRTAVDKFVTTADVRMASTFLQRGGIGERAAYVLRNLVSYGRFEGAFRSKDLRNDIAFTQRRFNQQMIYDFMNGRQMPYLMKEPSETVERFMARTGKECINISKLILDIKCQLYKDAPDRRFLKEDGDEAASPEDLNKIKRIYKRGALNASMREVDRFCYAFGYCLARWVRRPMPSAKQGDYCWELAVIPPTDFDFVTGDVDGFMGQQLTAVIFRQVIESSAQSLRTSPEYRQEIYTDKYYAVYERGALVKVEENAYGRIPFLYCTETGNYAERFRQPDMLETVLSNAELDRTLSLSNWASTFSGMPVTIITDNRNDAIPELPMVPGTIVPLESRVGDTGQGQATMKFEAPQDRTQSFVLHLKNELAMLLQSHGIQYSMTDGIKAGTSGVAVEVSQAPVVNYMKDRAHVAQIIETDAYHLLRDVAKTEVGEELPEVEYVEVDYPFEYSVQSAEERRKNVEFKLDRGLMSRAEALRTLEPERFASNQEAEDALPDEDEVLSIAGMGAGATGGNDANGNSGSGPTGVTGSDNRRAEGSSQPERAAQRNQEGQRDS